MYVELKGSTNLVEPNPQYKAGDLIRVLVSKRDSDLFWVFRIDDNLIARMVKDEHR